MGPAAARAVSKRNIVVCAVRQQCIIEDLVQYERETMAFVYFLICLVLITAGSLTKSFNAGQYFVLPIGVIAILFQKFVHREKVKSLGFKGCSFKHMGEAIAFPVIIIFVVFCLDYFFGLVKIRPLAEIINPFQKQLGLGLGEFILVILVSAFVTFIASFISEELGFRGYLITRFAGLGRSKALLLSSLLFGLWHIPPSLILIRSGALSTSIYAANIFLLGILFGHFFLASKSLLPSSLCHGVWNALEYGLFGYRNVPAVFYGNSRMLLDPEEGLVGTAVLLAFGFVVFWGKSREKKEPKNKGAVP